MARAAGCATLQGNAEFWKFHDLLFETAAEERAKPEFLINVAERAGLTVADFSSCLKRQLTLGMSYRDHDLGSRLGVDGTPTVFVNGVKIEGAISLDELRQAIKAQLSRHPSLEPSSK